ncbi:hypothetical protein ACFSM5_18155 [Lacibacterium aquatile]|uniref:Lipoprotein n=1 Tax=Lacibacterium aquatile TaxID=1168082 RepID=A0ABW5E066_9PROT
MHLRIIAAFGAAIFLAGCAAGPQGTVRDDLENLTAFTADLRYRWNMNLQSPDQSVTYQITNGPYANSRLRTALSSSGARWEAEYRVALYSLGFYHYGMSLRSKDGYLGSVGGILFPNPMPNLRMGAGTVDQKLEDRKPEEVLSRGVAKRIASGTTIDYARYRLRDTSCVIFAGSSWTAAIYGDICAPPGQPLGKSRAEAIVNGVGLAGQFSAEGADISTLPVD